MASNEAESRTLEEAFLEEYRRLGGEGQREEERVEAEERALGRFVGHHDEGTVEDLRRLLPERRPPVDTDPFPPAPSATAGEAARVYPDPREATRPREEE